MLVDSHLIEQPYKYVFHYDSVQLIRLINDNTDLLSANSEYVCIALQHFILDCYWNYLFVFPYGWNFMISVWSDKR